MTPTIELIKQINTEANYAYRATDKTGGILYKTLMQAAQRLRELDIENKRLEAVYATDGREFTRLNELVIKLDKPDCVWTYDMDQSMYDTSCGEAWRFDEGFLKDHSIKFCPFCAGQVKEST